MSSSVPIALPAFITLAESVLPANTSVIFNPTPPPFIAQQMLLITGIRFTQDAYAELGPNYRHEEHYNINCCLFQTGGMYNDQGSVQALVGTTYDIYDDLTVAIAQNPTLDIAQDTIGFRIAWTRQLSYMPSIDSKGMAFAALSFEVYCEARVLSLS